MMQSWMKRGFYSLSCEMRLRVVITSLDVKGFSRRALPTHSLLPGEFGPAEQAPPPIPRVTCLSGEVAGNKMLS